MAAVREPREPSMKPLSWVRWRRGSSAGWLARRSLRTAKRRVEVEPFGDAKRKFAGVLEFFEGEEVFPVGVVLDAGDAVGEDVGDGDGESLAALFEGWRRNFAGDEGVGGGFAKDAGGIAGGVAIDFGAGRVGGGGGDAGGGEGGGVGDGHVPVDAAEDGGMASGNGVEVGACGKCARSAQRV